MKKNITHLFPLFIVLLLLLVPKAYALVNKDEARTKIGNPAEINASDCPIPNGYITCGSKFTPSTGGCGHCAGGYGASEWCTGPKAYESINYSIDVGGAWGQETFLPKVNGNTISWTRLAPWTGTDQEIQRYAGTDTVTNEQYYIQFHHTRIGSAPEGTRLSGEHASNICDGCGGINGPHVHIEFGSSSASGTKWLDAPLYFCKK